MSLPQEIVDEQVRRSRSIALAPRNVWLGVSVEDQQRAEERIPHLLATPAAVRFLSCEPLLGPVDLERALSVYDGRQHTAFPEVPRG